MTRPWARVGLAGLCLVVIAAGCASAAPAATGDDDLSAVLLRRADLDYSGAARRVMVFYYPWYGMPDGPGGAGSVVHWGHIDDQAKDIEASTHYPTGGAYDSHDPKRIDAHCRMAKAAGIDTLIISWWGHGTYADRATPMILDACRTHGLTACTYYEAVPEPMTPKSAADDIVRVLEKYGNHPAHLKVDGKPVVFVYGRALEQLGLADWLKAVALVNAAYKPGAALIGDRFSYSSARVFDGIHTYNTCGSLRGLAPGAVRDWAAATFPTWVAMAERVRRISTLTVIPGYDDTKIRTPGLAVERFKGDLYRRQWEEAIKADPQWILITSFNEWHEGSEIEPSAEFGRAYLDLTAEYAKRFKAAPRKAPAPVQAKSTVSDQDKAALRRQLDGLGIAVLPQADSMAFWWLLTDLRVPMKWLTWDDVAAGRLTPDRYPILLHAGGELYRPTVAKECDVDAALKAYLAAGGTLVAMPSLPWPFFYDETGKALVRSPEFGLTLTSGWERPPDGARLAFVQPDGRLPHVPRRFPFPTAGDLRWRPFVAAPQAKHTSLLRLEDADGKNLGDAVACAELAGGGRALYVWFELLSGPHADGLLYDVFTFAADQLRK